MSKETVSFLLDLSEWLLLGSGVVLVVGIVGEYGKSDWWKKRIRLWEILVTIGVAGELLCDGGVFKFGNTLQRLEGNEIHALSLTSSGALTAAGDAQKSADNANGTAGEAQKRVESLRNEANALTLRIDQASVQTAKVLLDVQSIKSNEDEIRGLSIQVMFQANWGRDSFTEQLKNNVFESVDAAPHLVCKDFNIPLRATRRDTSRISEAAHLVRVTYDLAAPESITGKSIETLDGCQSLIIPVVDLNVEDLGNNRTTYYPLSYLDAQLFVNGFSLDTWPLKTDSHFWDRTLASVKPRVTWRINDKASSIAKQYFQRRSQETP